MDQTRDEANLSHQVIAISPLVDRLNEGLQDANNNARFNFGQQLENENIELSQQEYLNVVGQIDEANEDDLNQNQIINEEDPSVAPSVEAQLLNNENNLDNQNPESQNQN